MDLRTLSNRADLISGNDALVEVVLRPGTLPSAVRVSLNGDDVTPAFAMRDGRLIGLVTRLRLGRNELVATAGRGPAATLEVTNHPIGGPLFSGPQLQPWTCETETAGLGPAADAQCNAPTVVDYVYRSSDPARTGFLPYDPQRPPADVATITTVTGATVPFVVRRETGTINRGVYAIAVVADPARAVAAASPPAIWNGALHYLLQGGALPQHRQGPMLAAESIQPRNQVLQAASLSQGFAVASATLTTFGQNTNSVVSAETMVMVKERVAELLGEPKFTIGSGGSGGSIQLNLVANAYPGIVDGYSPDATYPDVWSANTEVQDCSLLVRYFDGPSAAMWGDSAQQNAVMGNANLRPGTCRSWVEQFHLDQGWMDPGSLGCFFPSGVLALAPGPVSRRPWMYDPVGNRSGARCTLQDYQRNLFGLRPDGAAFRPYDNVGVQYGLLALRSGFITPEQFVDLNEKVGGRDLDWNWTPARTEADRVALERLYRSGQYNLMTNVSGTPIVDARGCTNTEIHSCFNSFKLRERLREATGQIASHVLLLNKPAGDVSHLDLLARWVRGIRSDSSSASPAAKVLRHRPTEAVDACWIDGQRVTAVDACRAANPYFGDPRIAAGSPITVAAAKCQLMPLDRAAYPVPFTEGQWTRLREIFSQGVCDWSKPGVGAGPAVPWLSYAAGPGGEPLGPAPTARVR